jgi:hypothetical protein
LLRQTKRLMARRQAAIQATSLASRGVNLANAVVLLHNRRHAHAVPAVARALFETGAMAVYADRWLVPLLVKRRSKKPTRDAQRLLYRLELGNPSEQRDEPREVDPVDSVIKDIGTEADEVMKGDEDTPPPWVGEGTYGEAVRRSYSILSELTHPKSPAITLSYAVWHDEWILQPEIDDAVLTPTQRPSWVAPKAGRTALRDLVHTATKHQMESPTPTLASARTS